MLRASEIVLAGFSYKDGRSDDLSSRFQEERGALMWDWMTEYRSRRNPPSLKSFESHCLKPESFMIESAEGYNYAHLCEHLDRSLARIHPSRGMRPPLKRRGFIRSRHNFPWCAAAPKLRRLACRNRLKRRFPGRSAHTERVFVCCICGKHAPRSPAVWMAAVAARRPPRLPACVPPAHPPRPQGTGEIR